MTAAGLADPDPDLSDVAAWPPDLLALLRLALGLTAPRVAALLARELRALAAAERGEDVDPFEDIPEELLEGVPPAKVGELGTFVFEFGALGAAKRHAFASALIDCVAMRAIHEEAHRARPLAACPFCAGVLPAGDEPS